VKKALIIGGGIIGSSIAWRLAREGVIVTVLERGRLGREASWAAAGMLAAQADTNAPGPFFDLCIHGRDVLADTAETLRAESSVDPEYDHAGILYLAFNAAERDELEQRGRWQLAAGGAVEELSPAAARKLEPSISPDAVYALHFPMDHRVDNRKLTQAYTAAAIIKGACFVEGASAEAIIVNHGRAEAVRTHDGRLHHTDIIINAAGSWAGQVRGLESDKVETHPVRGQMVCFDARPGTLGPSIFSSRGYLVQRRDGRILAGSTMDEAGYDKSVTLAGLEKITHGALDNVPALGAIPFREAWAGLRPATSDLLPVIGPSPSVPNVFYATGHFRSGILLSAITGALLADLVMDRRPAFDLTPFSPARFAVAEIKVLGLVRDILLRSRIDAAAQALGLEVAYSPGLDQASVRAAELQPKIVFADLSDPGFPADRTAREIRAVAQSARLIGFASHVDLKSFSDARTAGFDLTLSRSEFTARLADLLSSSKSG
jgi:glycine oxidase